MSMGPRHHLVLCMQNSVISTLSLLVPVVFACKTATFGAELQLSIGPRPHLSFSASKTAWIASELLVSMGPRPHLWFLDAKQRLFDQNYKSLWVPVLTCRFVHAKQRVLHLYDKSIWVPALTSGFVHSKQRLRPKIACPYGPQTSPVIFCMQNCVPSIWITTLYGSQSSCVVFACKTSGFVSE